MEYGNTDHRSGRGRLEIPQRAVANWPGYPGYAYPAYPDYYGGYPAYGYAYPSYGYAYPSYGYAYPSYGYGYGYGRPYVGTSSLTRLPSAKA